MSARKIDLSGLPASVQAVVSAVLTVEHESDCTLRYEDYSLSIEDTRVLIRVPAANGQPAIEISVSWSSASAAVVPAQNQPGVTWEPIGPTGFGC